MPLFSFFNSFLDTPTPDLMPEIKEQNTMLLSPENKIR
jgi:hypothetical protein